MAQNGRPNPDGYKGGTEEFETVWNLKGHVAVPCGPNDLDTEEAACISRNHGRLSDAPGFGGL